MENKGIAFIEAHLLFMTEQEMLYQSGGKGQIQKTMR